MMRPLSPSGLASFAPLGEDASAGSTRSFGTLETNGPGGFWALTATLLTIIQLASRYNPSARLVGGIIRNRERNLAFSACASLVFWQMKISCYVSWHLPGPQTSDPKAVVGQYDPVPLTRHVVISVLSRMLLPPRSLGPPETRNMERRYRNVLTRLT